MNVSNKICKIREEVKTHPQGKRSQKYCYKEARYVRCTDLPDVLNRKMLHQNESLVEKITQYNMWDTP